MIRTQILLTPSLYEALKITAQEEGRSLSAIVRVSLEKMLKQKKSGKEILKEMLCHAVNIPDAPKDLSTNDYYLYSFRQ
jgi:hypothetical protein